MNTLKARGYQNEALTAIAAELVDKMRTAVVLPTGTGKTVVFSHLIARTLDEKASSKIVVLVHRDELAEQAAKKIAAVAPDARIGIVKAQRNEIDADVLICSVQTLARRSRLEQIDPATVGLVIADECHHATAKTWMDAIDYFDAPTVGFTATLYRETGLGLGHLWESVAYSKDIEWAIENGHLCDVRGQQVLVEGFDLAQIAKSKGDYQEGKLGDALISIGAGEVIAKAYHEHAMNADGTPKPGVIFAPTVASAYAFADDFNAAEIVTEVIHGEISKADREAIYARYESGQTHVLSTVMVLTEGWDSPRTEVCVVARPTQNPALYTQMVGRVLRPFPGKVEALVLDVVGIAHQHKLRTLATLTKTVIEEGESLTEARERIEAEENERGERTRITQAHKAREVDLFQSSHSVWLQTKGGTWFIPVRDGSICLYETAPGTYSVGRKMKNSAGEWMMKGLPLEYAMSWGEQFAQELDPMVADKGRTWRRAKPSEKQTDLALRLKLAPADEIVNMRRGALSDLLSVHFASRDLRALDVALAKNREAVSA